LSCKKATKIIFIYYCFLVDSISLPENLKLNTSQRHPDPRALGSTRGTLPLCFIVAFFNVLI
jgi:hypothetical protein